MRPAGDGAVRCGVRRIARRIATGIAVVVLGAASTPQAAWAEAGDDPVRLRITDEGLSLTGEARVRISGIVPGTSRSVGVLVENDTAEPMRLTVRTGGSTEVENGCTEPEREVDRSCGDTGELGSALRLSVRTRSGTATTSIPVAGAVDRQLTLPELAPGTSERVRLHLALPAEVGNRVQSDAVRFELIWRASATAGEPALEVAATASGGNPKPPGLALTGAEVRRLAVMAAFAVAAGVVLVRLGRRRLPHGEGPVGAADATGGARNVRKAGIDATTGVTEVGCHRQG